MTKSGFISIIGYPNTGKSTLLNYILGRKLSIVTSKAQTTRRSIMGVITDTDCQLIFHDTPGILNDAYSLLHKRMSKYVLQSLNGVDVVIFIEDVTRDVIIPDVVQRVLIKGHIPIILAINKIDKVNDAVLSTKLSLIKEQGVFKHVIPISAIDGSGVNDLLYEIKTLLPEHPFFYQSDTLTDVSERFCAAEIIREQIFEQMRDEVPYSSEVQVGSFIRKDGIIRISATIYVERQSQKGIMLGKGGGMIQNISDESRRQLKQFFYEDVFLELYVKVMENWRDNKGILRNFNYR